MEKFFKEFFHAGNESLCAEIPLELKELIHLPLLTGKENMSAENLRPSGCLLVIDSHALHLDLLAGERVLDAEEVICTINAELSQDRPLRNFLRKHTVLNSEPQELIVLIGAPRAPVRVKEGCEAVHIEPLDSEPDDHVEIHIDLAGRVERNIGRLKIVPPCRIPYVISCPPGIPGVFTSDHTSYSKTTARLSSAGILAFTTSMISDCS